MPTVIEWFEEYLKDTYKIIRKKPGREDWPPYLPTSIVNVTVIHYKNKQTRQELIKVSEYFKTGATDISKLVHSPPSHTKVTKDISEIFKVDPADQIEEGTESEPPKLILIEGAPGIGKTILAKEIAYLWATSTLLTGCKLVILVYLRDPRVHTMTSVKELLQLYATEKVAAEVEEYLKEFGGENVAFVFDGFDEFPASQENSIVTDIISNKYGRKFSKSIVVITSRPTATLLLHKEVDRRIEILGFAAEERDKLISLSVSQFPDRRTELKKYFEKNVIISSLCYIPLNLAIVLYLFHQGSLPETLTEMNESFVIHTVYRHLKKTISPLTGCIDHLIDMPKNVYQILHKLSRLAFERLYRNQIVFTYKDLKHVCPEVYQVPEAVNGFSLLQAVEHHPQKGVGITTSFNFLHLTMQEYLAAYYVSTLPEERQLELLQATFWDGHFNFMWIMYVGIVGVKSGAFASFVRMINTEQTEVLDEFATSQLDKRLKNLHLFQCYIQAKTVKEIPQGVSSIFSNGNINLTGITLLPHHVTSLLIFISASVQQWKSLNLSNCNLQRKDMYNLLQNINNNKERMSTLELVDLSFNGLSPWDVYCAIIRHCCVNSLTLCGDEGMEGYVKDITDSLQANTTLQSLTLCSMGKIGVESIKTILGNDIHLKILNLSWIKIQSEGIKRILFHTFYSSTSYDIMQSRATKSDSSRVVDVNIIYDGNINRNCLPSSFSNNVYTQSYESKAVINLNDKNIDDDAVHVLAFGLCNNTTVEELNVSNNNITDEGVFTIIDCLKYNKSLKKLDLSQNEINFNGKLLKYIDNQERSGTLLVVDLSKNQSSPWGMYCAVIRRCCANSLTLCGDEGMDEYIKEIIDSLQANATLNSLTLLSVGKIGVESIKTVLMNNNTLKSLNLSWKKKDAVNFKIQTVFVPTTVNARTTVKNTDRTIVNVTILCNIKPKNFSYSQNMCIENFSKSIDLDGESINDDGACVLAFGLHNNTTIEEFNAPNNGIGDEGAIAIIYCLKYNTILKKLDLSYNRISVNGMTKMLENIKNQVTPLSLEYVDLRNNQTSPWSVYCAIIRYCCRSNLTLCVDEGIKQFVHEILDSLQVNTTLQSLALHYIRNFNLTLCKNALKSFRLSQRKEGSKKLFYFSLDSFDSIYTYGRCTIVVLYDECSPKNIDLSSCNINDDNIKHLKRYNNTKIEKLNISHNSITDNGVGVICKCLKHHEALKKLDLSQNIICINGMNKISKNIESQGTTSLLEYVDLSENGFSPWGVYCAIIRHCHVNKLTLCGDEGMKEYIKEITDSLQGNTILQSLTLFSIGKFGVESIEAILKNNCTLKRLKLSWKKIKSISVEKILTRTVFSQNSDDKTQNEASINDTGRVVNVTILYDDDASHNQSLPSSDIVCTPNFEPKTVVNLSGKEINDNAAHVLAFGLCNNTTVEELNTSSSGVGNEGAIAIMDCLKYNKTLKKLDLSQNKININGMNKMLNNIKNQRATLSLEYIDLSKNYSSPWSVYCTIIKHCCVNSLTFCGDKGMKEYVKNMADSLQANVSLQTLTLFNVGKVGIESIKALFMNDFTLKTLNLSWEKSNSKYIIMQTKMTVDDTNRVMNVNILYDDDNISHSQVPFSSCDIFCKSKTINLCKKIHNDDAAHVLAFGLCNNATVENLYVSHNFITDEGAIAIIGCLKHNKILKKLDMSQNRISINGMKKILEYIKDQVPALSLEYVDLSENCSPPWGGRGSSPWDVYCAIIRYCCVNSLTLCGDEGMKEYIKDITDSLQANITLQSLTLCSIGKIGAESIMTVLGNNIHIKRLNLSWIKIQSESILFHTFYSSTSYDVMQIKAKRCDRVVNINIIYDGNINRNCLLSSFSNKVYTQRYKSKTVVNLNGENINDDAAHVLAFGLYSNTTVEELNVSNNNITDEGALAIINCLKLNKTLKRLDLSQNRINFNGMNRLLENFENEGTAVFFEYVDLCKNQASPWGVYCAIIRHCCVDSLTLCGDKGMKEYIKEILDSLQINIMLQSLTLRDIGEGELQLFENAVSSLNKSLMRNKRENGGKFRYFLLSVSYGKKSTVLVNIDISII